MSERLEKLHNFLRGNVVSPSTPRVITLSDFEFDIKDFKGSFRLTLDSDVMKERFRFGIEIDGKYEISPPFHISPMGVPASFPKIQLTEETTAEITRLINEFFPKIRPLGVNQESGLLITRDTPMIDRVVDAQSMDLAINEITFKEFKMKSELKR